MGKNTTAAVIFPFRGLQPVNGDHVSEPSDKAARANQWDQ